jgi:hypothetical protein
MAATRKSGKKGLGHALNKAKQKFTAAVDPNKEKKKKPTPPESPSTLAPLPVAKPITHKVDAATLQKFKAIDLLTESHYVGLVTALKIYRDYGVFRNIVLQDTYCAEKLRDLMASLFLKKATPAELPAKLIYEGKMTSDLLLSLISILNDKDFTDELVSHHRYFPLGHATDVCEQLARHFDGSKIIEEKKSPREATSIVMVSTAEPVITAIPKPHPAPLMRTASLSPEELVKARADKDYARPAPTDAPPALPAHLKSASAPVMSVGAPPPPPPPRPPVAGSAKPLPPKHERATTDLPVPPKKQTAGFIPDPIMLAEMAARRAEKAAAQALQDAEKLKESEALAKEKEEKKEEEKRALAERRRLNALAALGRGKAAPIPSAATESPRKFERRIAKPSDSKAEEPLTPIAPTATETVVVLTEAPRAAIPAMGPPPPSTLPPPLPPTKPAPSERLAPLVAVDAPIPLPPPIRSVPAIDLLKAKISAFSGPEFVSAGLRVDAMISKSDSAHQGLLAKELKPITDLSSQLSVLQDDLAKDMAKQKAQGKLQSEINDSDASFICQQAVTLIDALASEKTYEEKLTAIVDFKTQCQQKKSGWKIFGEIVASVAIAAVSFAFVAASAIALGVAFGVITLPAGPGAAAGVLAGIVAGANWAIGILTGSGVLATSLGIGSAIKFFKPSARDSLVKDIASNATVCVERKMGPSSSK